MPYEKTSVGLASLSCGGIGHVEVREQLTNGHLAVPRITAERLQAFVKDHGEQLESGSWAFSPEIRVNQEGYVVGVDVGGVPETAPDLAACTRIALRDIAIPSAVFDMRVPRSSASMNESTVGQRAYLGSPALVVVVVVGLSELVFEAGAYTILFAVTVKVVDKAIDDVAAHRRLEVRLVREDVQKDGNLAGIRRPWAVLLETCRSRD